MTIEEIFSDLYDKYDEDFNWYMIPLTQADGVFVTELKNEIGEDPRSMATRSSTVKSGVLALLTSTATITLSNIRLERLIISRCPFVTGSKLPGYMAMVGMGGEPFRLDLRLTC